MGKLISYITIIVVIDLLFIITGQISESSPTSMILQAAIDPALFLSSNFYLQLLGGAGIAALLTVGGVLAGLVTSKSDIFLFAGMALGMSYIAQDYISIFSYLAAFNRVLAVLCLSPIIVLLPLIVVEWLRGRD